MSDTVAHHIEFEGGGRFWFVMDAQATGLKVHARNMSRFVGDDGVIILFGPGIPPDAPPEVRAIRRAD